MRAFTVTEDPLHEYLALKYPKSNLCVIHFKIFYIEPDHADFIEEYKYSLAMAEKYGVDHEDIISSGFGMIVEGTFDEMMDLCNSIPDNGNYAVVISKGEVIHENT